MSVYHISDTHFGHKNIIKFRPFSTVEEHDEYVLDNILSTLHKRDKIIFHGDLAFTREALSYVRKIVESVSVAELILGNHDLENRHTPSLLELNEVFDGRVYAMKKYKETWLTHAPLHPEELRGRYNIHGHVHGNIIDDGRYFDVSCENIGYVPIEHTKLMERIRGRL